VRPDGHPHDPTVIDAFAFSSGRPRAPLARRAPALRLTDQAGAQRIREVAG
jgi:hypothetical protein